MTERKLLIFKLTFSLLLHFCDQQDCGVRVARSRSVFYLNKTGDSVVVVCVIT